MKHGLLAFLFVLAVALPGSAIRFTGKSVGYLHYINYADNPSAVNLTLKWKLPNGSVVYEKVDAIAANDNSTGYHSAGGAVTGVGAFQIWGYLTGGQSIGYINCFNDAASTDVVTFAPPVVTSMSPLEGYAGLMVSIIGNNFYDVSAVTFGGVNASYTVNNPSSISAIVPEGASSGSVAVVTAYGSSSYGSPFEIVAAPSPPPSVGWSEQVITALMGILNSAVFSVVLKFFGLLLLCGILYYLIRLFVGYFRFKSGR